MSETATAPEPTWEEEREEFLKSLPPDGSDEMPEPEEAPVAEEDVEEETTEETVVDEETSDEEAETAEDEAPTADDEDGEESDEPTEEEADVEETTFEADRFVSLTVNKKVILHDRSDQENDTAMLQKAYAAPQMIEAAEKKGTDNGYLAAMQQLLDYDEASGQWKPKPKTIEWISTFAPNDLTGVPGKANQSGPASNANQSGNQTGASLTPAELEALTGKALEENTAEAFMEVIRKQGEELLRISGQLQAAPWKQDIDGFKTATEQSAAQAVAKQRAAEGVQDAQRTLRPLYRDHEGKVDEAFMARVTKAATDYIDAGHPEETILKWVQEQARGRQQKTRDLVAAVKADRARRSKKKTAAKPKRTSAKGKAAAAESADIRDQLKTGDMSGIDAYLAEISEE